MSRPNVNLDQFQRRAALAVFVAVAVVLCTLAGRLAYITTQYRAKLLADAKHLQESARVIPARRGMILDRAGRVVAATRYAPDIFVDPFGVKDLDALAMEIAPRLNLAPDDIVSRIQARPKSRYIVLAREVDDVTADAVRAMHDSRVGLTDHPVRYYPLGSSMAHVIGFVGRDGHGLEGIERRFDKHLHGTDGRRETIRDARRRALLPAAAASEPPVDGGHIVLTIDAEIQRIVEKILADQVSDRGAQSGVALMMDIHSGQLLAMACCPSFDLNNAGNVPVELRRNRAITDPVEPGSTFKMIIASGALDHNKVNLTEKIDCNNGRPYRFPGRSLQDTSPHGMLNLTGILTFSSNVGMGKIGMRMGPELLYDTITGFGFGRPTGIQLDGESGGLVHPLKDWSKLSPTSVAIGYEVMVTPLQLLNAYAATLNDGIQLRPTLVEAMLAPDGSVIRSFDEPDPLRRVSSSDTAHYMAREALVSAGLHGGGRRANKGRYRVLGKTGTAKLVYPDRKGYEPGAYLSLFVGAAPAHDPRVATVVAIRRPDASRGYYGSLVAAPAAGRILNETLSYLGVPAPTDLAAASP